MFKEEEKKKKKKFLMDYILVLYRLFGEVLH